MVDYGISATGFQRKRLDLLLQELNDEMQSIFGANFNVSPESPDGQVNGVVSESNANLWEIAEAAYNAFNPSAATNVSLSNLVQLNGITRQEETFSTSVLTCVGLENTVIPAGSIVTTSNASVSFTTDSEVTIPVGLTIDVDSTAVNPGPLEALATSLSVIDTPVTGWNTVTNADDAILGQFEETDSELRARRAKSVARQSITMSDSIIAEVEAVDGVTFTSILVNETNVTDSNGIPAHEFLTIVEGGLDAEIATAIFTEKAIGIGTFGTTTEQVEDSQGVEHDISFSRPDQITIYIDMDITTFSDFPQDGVEDIKQAIVDYANGDLVAGRAFGVGDDVIYSELFAPINTIDGVQVDTLYVNTTGSPGAGDVNTIAIAFDERSEFLITNIEVNI